jgi:REP element-mobilizing transposase RayT
MRATKNIRLQNYDYSTNGYYFVTITTNYRKPYLKDRYNLVKKTIEDLNLFEGVKVDYYTIMIDHIHLILILNDCKLKLGEIIRRLKAVTSKKAGFRLWQPNYYEHVIRNEIALGKIREYIVNNPEAEQIEFEQFYKTL